MGKPHSINSAIRLTDQQRDEYGRLWVRYLPIVKSHVGLYIPHSLVILYSDEIWSDLHWRFIKAMVQYDPKRCDSLDGYISLMMKYAALTLRAKMTVNAKKASKHFYYDAENADGEDGRDRFAGDEVDPHFAAEHSEVVERLLEWERSRMGRYTGKVGPIMYDLFVDGMTCQEVGKKWGASKEAVRMRKEQLLEFLDLSRLGILENKNT